MKASISWLGMAEFYTSRTGRVIPSCGSYSIAASTASSDRVAKVLA